MLIAGAGGAAHLPGMTAAKTTLPVLGVPVESKALHGHGLAALDRADAGRRARSRRSRSGAPARSTRRCSRPPILAGSRRGARASALRRFRAAQTQAVLDAARSRRVARCGIDACVALHRRRPARPDARARGAAARLSLPLPRPVAGRLRARGRRARRRRTTTTPTRSTGSPTAPTSSPTSSRTCPSRRRVRVDAVPAAAALEHGQDRLREKAALPLARDPDGALRLARGDRRSRRS